MRTRPPKPVSLRPIHPMHKRWFWILMGIGMVMIVVGWVVTIRRIILEQTPVIKEQVSEQVQQAGEYLEQRGMTAIEASEDISNNFELLQEAYRLEKEQQESPTVETNPETP